MQFIIMRFFCQHIHSLIQLIPVLDLYSELTVVLIVHRQGPKYLVSRHVLDAKYVSHSYVTEI